MLVKQRYNSLSEQLMFEWTLETPTPFNRAKRMHYAFFQSVKDLEVKELTFEEVMRINKIEEIQLKELRRR